jgi:hypothetical protein
MMLLDPALALGATAGCTQELPDFLPADTDTLVLNQHFDEMSIIEVLVFLLMEDEDFGRRISIQGVTHRPASVLVAQPPKTFSTPPFLYPFRLSIADAHEGSSVLQGQGMLRHLLKNVPPVSFLLIQDYESLHVLHLHEGDIISLQLQGT